MHILEHLARQHQVQVATELGLRDAFVAATDAAISEILFNLIKNAIEAARETTNGRVHISTDVDSSESDNRIAVISIRDNGPGIADGIQDHIFEPFVTGKTDGTGLGLYLVAERVRELQGQIHYESNSSGTIFEVHLAIHEGHAVE